jgi:hypothetical protein
MKRLYEAASWFLTGMAVGLLVISVILVPEGRALAQSAAAGGQCNANGDFLECNNEVKNMDDQCAAGAGDCTNNGTNCAQKIDPTDCSACVCVNVQQSCLCKKQ